MLLLPFRTITRDPYAQRQAFYLNPRYVVAVLAVFVDDSVDDKEFLEIKSAAEMFNAKAEVRHGLAEGMEHQLLQLERQTGNENAEDEGGTVTNAVVQMQAQPASAMVLMETSDGASAPETLVGQQDGIHEQDGSTRWDPRTSSTTSEVAPNRSTGFKFVLVMEFGERSLQEALTHDHIAGKDFFAIRKMGSDLAHALAHVHSKNRIHADFKPLNAMRPSSTWLLIDMDVMCFI